MDFEWQKEPAYFETILSYASLRQQDTPFAIGTFSPDADNKAPLHWHDAFEIGYILEGEGITVLEGEELEFKQGQVHVINNEFKHMNYPYATAKVFNVHFLPDLIQDPLYPRLSNVARLPFMPEIYNFRPILPPDDPHTEKIIELLNMIASEHEQQAQHWELMVKGLLLQIVTLLTRHFRLTTPQDEDALHRQRTLNRLSPALSLIEERLSENLSLEELAESVSLSPSYFGTLFKEAVGESPIGYRNIRRVAVAKQLLSETDELVSGIASECGFATVQQFNKVFRDVVEITPSTYRQKYKIY